MQLEEEQKVQIGFRLLQILQIVRFTGLMYRLEHHLAMR